MGSIPPPRIIPGSVRPREVVLAWPSEIKLNEDNSMMSVQWRLEKRKHETDWFDADTLDSDIDSSTSMKQVKVLKLEPFTSYQFRLVAEVGAGREKHPLAHSQPSPGVSTKPEGPPATPPTFLSIRQLPNLNINVTFLPPEFPNGEIIFYRLYIKENTSGTEEYYAAREIPPTSKTQSYVTGPLECNSSYVVKLSAVNAEGESSNATKIFQTTCPGQSSAQSSVPFAFFSTENSVYRKDIRIGVNLWDLHEEVIKLSEEVASFDLHQVQTLIFLCDISGHVYRAQLFKRGNITSEKEELIIDWKLSPATKVSRLSVDWLNEKLYLLLESHAGNVSSSSSTFWYIIYCDLLGQDCEKMELTIERKPSHMKVDPYHGYVYWLERQGEDNSWLYRMDLPTATNCGKQKELLLSGSRLGPFIISFTQYALFTPELDTNKMVRISLDSKHETSWAHDMYKMDKKGFKDITAMIMYQDEFDRFYWSSEAGFNIEFFDKKTSEYSYSLLDDTIQTSQMELYHPSAQPYPIPLNPIEDLQVIFDSKRAMVKWSEPLGGNSEGCAAWIDWNYVVKISDENDNLVVFQENLKDKVWMEDSRLMPETLYQIQVQAYSGAGSGPWSTTFSGRTLAEQRIPMVIWSDSVTVNSMDVFGQELKSMGENMSNARNIVWHDETETLFWTNGASIMRKLKKGETEIIRTDQMEISSLAMDTFGEKLYYSVPKMQRITRITFDGAFEASLPIATMARNLVIDSQLAKLCWIYSQNAIECSNLDGSEKEVIDKFGMWEDNKIVNMAVDQRHHVLYITIYNPISADRYSFYQKEIQGNVNRIRIGSLNTQRIHSHIQYLDRKLFFIQNGNEFVTFDIDGNGLSKIPCKSPVDSFYLAVEQQRGQTNLCVNPEKVPTDSIVFLGSYSNFSLIWTKTESVNFGEVKYRVRLSTQEWTKQWVVKEPHINVSDKISLDPFTSVNVTIASFTSWAVSPAARIQLVTPESVPTEATNLRVFWTNVNETVTQYTLRWSPPARMNGELLHYNIRCMKIKRNMCAGLKTVSMAEDLILPQGVYKIAVAGVTHSGEGKYSKTFQTWQAASRPIPRVAMGVSYPPAIILADADIGSSAVHQLQSEPEHIAFLHWKNAFIIIDKSGLVKSMDFQNYQIKDLIDLKHSVSSTAVDWMGHYLYWSDNEAGGRISRADLDMDRPMKHSVLTKSGRIVQIEYHTSGQLFFTTKTNDSYQLFKCNLSPTGEPTEPTKMTGSKRKRRSGCSCPAIRSVDSFSIVPDTNRETDDVAQLIVRDAQSGNIYLTDENLCRCKKVFETEKIVENYSIEADLTKIYVLSKHDRNATVLDLSGQRATALKLNNSQPACLSVACRECQTIKKMNCLQTRTSKQPAVAIHRTSTTAKIRLPHPRPEEGCTKPIPLPSTEYIIAYSTIPEEAAQLCPTENSSCKTKLYYNEGNALDRIIQLTHLTPNTQYTVNIRMQNVYTKNITTNPGIKKEDMLNVLTEEDAPSSPQSLVIQVLSPTVISVTWNEPEIQNSNKIIYQIHWQSVGYIQGKIRNSHIETDGEMHNGKRSGQLTDLAPSQKYTIWVLAKSKTGLFNNMSISEKISVKTFAQPNKIYVNAHGPRFLNISWTAPNNTNIGNHSIVYYPVKSNSTKELKTQAVSYPAERFSYTVENLSPGVCYVIKVKVVFSNSQDTFYQWPNDNSTCHRTDEDVPQVPGIPYITESSTGQVIIAWNENDENIKTYDLQSKFEDSEEAWSAIYSNTRNQFVVTGLNGTYLFRVQASNEFGYSSYSNSSPPYDIEKIRLNHLHSKRESKVITVSTISITVVGFLLFVLIILCMVNKNRHFNTKKKALSSITPGYPDLELANLRELPFRAGFIDANNPMYQIEAATDEDLELIPKIERSQITLTKFLGSGAFGEVFEGLVKELHSEDGVASKIAVKTLRKGASENEKIEFLKEAKLMWNFKHDHILNLIAICLDNDPNFLILELMEAGDLLSYLRANRPNALTQGVTLTELIQMCLDVAKGCEYLEQLHFVHRDIAARNCLVSSLDPDKRRIKIGDFGLARDIYKNDYYKKEGEGLLPVRWMSPESLSDGVFSCQSDVWSFGVLLWEILTMGAKPYPTMSNWEVLQYVRSGGRLEKPSGAPERLHVIMTSCWNQDPDDRPTFKMCVQEIESLLDSEEAMSEISGGYIRYGCHYLNGPSPHPQSISTNSSQSGSLTNSHYHSATTVPLSQVSRRTILTNSSGVGSTTPNYLQLLHENDIDSDNSRTPLGYEVPRSNQSSKCGCNSSSSSGFGYQNLHTNHVYTCDYAVSSNIRQ